MPRALRCLGTEKETAVRRLLAAILFSTFALPGGGFGHILADSSVPGECQGDAVAPLEDIAPTLPADLLPGLLRWIARATDYDVADSLASPPSVAFCAKGDVILYESGLITVPHDLRAAYDLIEERVLLVRPWDADSLRDRSALLHELVHHVQMKNRSWECPQAPEWQAYELQEAWLAEQGIEAGFDWLQIYFRSKCPRDIHP